MDPQFKSAQPVQETKSKAPINTVKANKLIYYTFAGQSFSDVIVLPFLLQDISYLQNVSHSIISFYGAHKMTE